MSPSISAKPWVRTLVGVAIALACPFAAMSASVHEAASAGSGGMVTELDIPYPPPPGGDPAKARLDIFHVPDGRPKRWMVFVHGGSWVGGDKSNLQSAANLVPWFVARDYAVAAVNFRLASPVGSPPTVTYADQVTDVAYALAWLNHQAATYGVTQSAPLLVGYSSGAHLVALLAAHDQYLLSAGLPARHLYAAISLDVHAYDVPYALQLMQGSQIAGNIPLIEHLFGTTTAQQRVGSPSHYVGSANVAPSLLVSADPSAVVGSKGYIAAQASRRHWERLEAAGVLASWSHFDAETHQSLIMNFGAAGDAPTEAVRAFLDQLEAVTAVEESPAPSLVLAVAPNPASGAAAFAFSLAREALLQLDVFDVAGRRVRALMDTVSGPGSQRVKWDGRDDSGRRLESGAYVARLRVNGRVAATRTLLLER